MITERFNISGYPNLRMKSQRDKWLRSYTAPNTRDRYGRSLSKFLGHFKISPEETLDWTVEEAEDRMLDWQAQMVEEGLAGASIQTNFTGVKQWFQFNRIRVQVRCKGTPAKRTYFDYIPSRKDVQSLLDAAKLHHKVGIALIAFSGLRPVDVVTLRYENIRASYETGDTVLTIIKLHQKTGEWYPTFIGTQGTRYIRSFIESRKAKGEKITNESHVVVWEKGPLRSEGLRISIKRIIDRTVGRYPTGEPFRKFRAYGLRKYFRKTVDSLGEDIAELLMGHRKGLLSLSSTYSGIRDMDPQAIKALRKKYISILPELETEITDTTLKAQIEEKEKRIRSYEVRMDEIQEDQKRLQKFLERLEERDKEG